jgi:hypothetical protein
MSDQGLSRDRIYEEIRSDIRATDDISFKLMGLVPVVSGAAFLTFLLEDKLRAQPPVVIALCLFAALISLGLFRWELRNIQNCSWLLRRSEAMVEEAMVEKVTSITPARPKRPLGIGKAEAEKWIYTVTILAWLLMPALVCPLNQASTGMLALYATLALFTAVMTVQSALTTIRIEPIGRPATQGGDTRGNPA